MGTTAIATAISLRTYVQSESNQTNSCTLNISLKSNLLSYSWKLEDLAFTGISQLISWHCVFSIGFSDKIGDFNDNEQLGNFVKSKTNDVNPQYLAPACQSFLLGCLLFGRGYDFKGPEFMISSLNLNDHNLINFFSFSRQSVTSTVKSQIPVGVGLGSSGAYNVSLALSLMVCL